MRIISTLAIAILMLFPAALKVAGGRPPGPHRHPPERRQANMLMLRFQDALAAGRWEAALAFCSERVRTSAATWPDPKSFFTETTPIEHVLEQDFACWSCSTNFYGLFVTLSEHGAEPRIDWHWALVPTEHGWAVDYGPVQLKEYVLSKEKAFQQRDGRVKQIRLSLEAKVQGVKTRLTALSDRFVIGSPMLFRVELINSNEVSVHYMDMGVQHKPLIVLNQKGDPVRYVTQPLQIKVKKSKLRARTSVVLGDKIDINQGHEIAEPGRYFVQFDSVDLRVGQPVPPEEMGRFGENLPLSVFNEFVAATNKFPSNVIEIEVHP